MYSNNSSGRSGIRPIKPAIMKIPKPPKIKLQPMPQYLKVRQLISNKGYK